MFSINYGFALPTKKAILILLTSKEGKMILQEQYLLVITVLNVFILSLKYILKIIHVLKSDRLLYLYRLSCLHVPLCTVCVPGAVRNQKRTRIDRNWNNRSLGRAISMLSSKPGSLEDQPVFLTVEPSLSLKNTSFMNLYVNNVFFTPYKDLYVCFSPKVITVNIIRYIQLLKHPCIY